MDIQEMVDLRIAEIQSRAERKSVDSRNPEFGPGGNSKYQPKNKIFKKANLQGNTRSLQPDFQNRFDDCDDVIGSVDHLDRILAQVAVKMLDITEMIAGDYGRLENDILKARLAVLQSAESILDISVSLRKKAIDMGADLPFSSPGIREKAKKSAGLNDYDSLNAAKGRASMHSNGVADLFKRT